MIAGYCPNIAFRGTMLTTDLDGTLLIPSNEHMKIDVEDRLYDEYGIQKAENAVKRNNIDTVLLNTGRNFTELGEVQDLLEKTTMPVDAISLEDGKRLLTKPKSMTSQQWIKALFNKNINYLMFKDKNWTAKNDAPLKAIGTYLTKEKGFIHRNDNGEKMIYSKPIEKGDTGVTDIPPKDGLWIVTLVPPGIDFEVSVRNVKDTDNIDTEAFNSEISAEIQEMLKEKGFEVTDLTTKEKTCYANSIERTDVDKGKVADYVRSNTPNVTSEIRAGNAYNDESMLTTRMNKTQVIQVGNDPKLTRILSAYSNVTRVDEGNLGNGIEQACNKLNLCA